MIHLIEKHLKDFKPKFNATLYWRILAIFPALAILVPIVFIGMPHLEFFNDMARQPKGKAQMEYGLYFKDHKMVAREPVANTIPSNYEYFHLADKSRVDVREQKLSYLQNPVVATEEVLRRGQDRYDIYCTVCHGQYGQGDGLATKAHRKSGYSIPPSFQGASTKNMEDGEIFHIITNGAALMPAYGGRISPEDRWAITHYIRALQRAFDPKKEDLKGGNNE